MKQGLSQTWRVIVTLYHQFFDVHCPSRAASLAYTTLLSLVPLMLVVFYILSWFPAFKEVGPTLQQFILSNFVADSANIISQYLHDFILHLRRLSIINISFLGMMSVLMIYNMVGAFNEIWGIRRRRHFVAAFGIYLLVLLFTPLVFGVLVVLLSYFSSLPFITTVVGTMFVKKSSFLILPHLCEFIVFAFLNWVLPSTRVRLLYAIISGFITMVLFEFAKYGFGVYLRYVPTYRLIYGALATIPIFLIWIYLSWLIILFGVLVCRFMTEGLGTCTK